MIHHVVHLTASRFFGGPERQMLGLAAALPANVKTTFLSFAEGGRCDDFLDHAREQGHDGRRLRYDTPRLWAAVDEITACLSELRADVLLCHGYKSDLLGLRAARKYGIPAVAVSRGWTAEDLKVRIYEALDRRCLRRMDRVVCVSTGQAQKVRAAGVQEKRLRIIRNSARLESFPKPSSAGRARLRSFLNRPGDKIAVTAARLSPEKGIDVLIEAARQVCILEPQARFVVFGDGHLRESLAQQIRAAGLDDVLTLAGFRDDLDELIPNADLMVLPSFNEGLPNVVLEAFAAGLPVVATAVGGTPEVVLHGVNGFLVKPGDVQALAVRIAELLAQPGLRPRMGEAGKAHVAEHFTFAAQAREYLRLFEELIGNKADSRPIAA